MNEYTTEDGNVDIEKLRADPMDEQSYKIAHQSLVIPCHDVFIGYKDGILIVKRLNFPARNILWPLGGRIKRGMAVEDSLRERILKESGLELDNLIELGYARTYFKTDPFSHGKGTDTINFVFFSKGKGGLNLDRLHDEPTIILPKNYQLIKNSLHPYVRDFMDLAIPIIS